MVINNIYEYPPPLEFDPLINHKNSKEIRLKNTSTPKLGVLINMFDEIYFQQQEKIKDIGLYNKYMEERLIRYNYLLNQKTRNSAEKKEKLEICREFHLIIYYGTIDQLIEDEDGNQIENAYIETEINDETGKVKDIVVKIMELPSSEIIF